MAAPVIAPTPPPTAAPIPAPRPPPAIAPITAPVPAPIRPPPIARSAGLYGSAKAVVANNSPAPIRLTMGDCFLGTNDSWLQFRDVTASLTKPVMTSRETRWTS